MPLDIQSLLTAMSARPHPGGVASGGKTLPMEAISRRVEALMGGQQPTMGAGDGPPPELAGDMSGGTAGADPGDALAGLPDSRGLVGTLARGANMYPGGGPAQQGGGQQFGAPPVDGMLPPRNAVLRRIMAQRGGNGLLA